MLDLTGLPHASQQPPAHVHPHRRFALRGASVLGWIVYGYIVVTEIVLALGFVLLLFGANSEPAFVQWSYRSLDRAMAPFRGIFNPIELGRTNSEVPAVLDTSVLFAMLVYGILGWLVSLGLNWFKGRLAQQDLLDWQADQQRHQTALWQAEQERQHATQRQQTQLQAEEWQRQRAQIQAEADRRLAEQERQRAELERQQVEDRRRVRGHPPGQQPPEYGPSTSNAPQP